jgi:hypothetical protein
VTIREFDVRRKLFTAKFATFGGIFRVATCQAPDAEASRHPCRSPIYLFNYRRYAAHNSS